MDNCLLQFASDLPIKASIFRALHLLVGRFSLSSFPIDDPAPLIRQRLNREEKTCLVCVLLIYFNTLIARATTSRPCYSRCTIFLGRLLIQVFAYRITNVCIYMQTFVKYNRTRHVFLEKYDCRLTLCRHCRVACSGLCKPNLVIWSWVFYVLVLSQQ